MCFSLSLSLSLPSAFFTPLSAQIYICVLQIVTIPCLPFLCAYFLCSMAVSALGVCLHAAMCWMTQLINSIDTSSWPSYGTYEGKRWLLLTKVVLFLPVLFHIYVNAIHVYFEGKCLILVHPVITMLVGWAEKAKNLLICLIKQLDLNVLSSAQDHLGNFVRCAWYYSFGK